MKRTYPESSPPKKTGPKGITIEIEKAMALLRRIDGFDLSEEDRQQQAEAVCFLREAVVRHLKRNRIKEKKK
nr:MAG TPA: hypothetical protein [Caudoviricetes sp.]